MDESLTSQAAWVKAAARHASLPRKIERDFIAESCAELNAAALYSPDYFSLVLSFMIPVIDEGIKNAELNGQIQAAPHAKEIRYAFSQYREILAAHDLG